MSERPAKADARDMELAPTKFTYSSQKVLKPSNIFLGRAGMIILSGEKPDNLLPLSFLKNEALRREPGGFHFA